MFSLYCFSLTPQLAFSVPFIPLTSLKFSGGGGGWHSMTPSKIVKKIKNAIREIETNFPILLILLQLKTQALKSVFIYYKPKPKQMG